MVVTAATQPVTGEAARGGGVDFGLAVDNEIGLAPSLAVKRANPSFESRCSFLPLFQAGLVVVENSARGFVSAPTVVASRHRLRDGALAARVGGERFRVGNREPGLAVPNDEVWRT